MQTHYLGLEQVQAYLRDLASRLLALNGELPTAWVTIGLSGIELAEQLLMVEPQLEHTAKFVGVDFDRDTNTVLFEDGDSKLIAGNNVIVLDSSIHSGHTMQAVVNAVTENGAKAICSYTLVLKQNSIFIPSFWGVTIGDHDRAYFLLDVLPNNHFCDIKEPHDRVRDRGQPGKKTPYFHIRKLCRSDLCRPLVKSSTESLDRASWADRYYEMKSTPNRATYVLEVGRDIVGYLTIDRAGSAVKVEAVAVDAKLQGRGYGPALIRWAETLARQTQARAIKLWAISTKEDWYKRQGYQNVPGVDPMDLGGEVYFLMQKAVLSHLGLGQGLS